MMPSITGLLVLLGLMLYTTHRTIAARNYSAIGYAFLNHALEVFKETNDAHEIEMLTDVAIPHVKELNEQLAGRIGLLMLANLALGAVMFASTVPVDGAYLMTVSVLISIYGGYSLSRTGRANDEIDDVCDACDEDLIAVDRPGEYQIMLNKYMDDPVD